MKSMAWNVCTHFKHLLAAIWYSGSFQVPYFLAPLQVTLATDKVDRQVNYLLMWKKFLAETEVCKDDMTLWVQENIFQLNISIDDSQLQQTNEQIAVTLQRENKTRCVNFMKKYTPRLRAGKNRAKSCVEDVKRRETTGHPNQTFLSDS
jgi:hypothetical protein